MTQDEIWQKIKEDKTKIYGETMLDVFLQTTDYLSLKHYLELTNKQKDFIKSKQIINSLFIKSVAANMKDVALDFIKKGVSDMSWALRIAAEKGHVEIAKILLDLGTKDYHRSAVDAARNNRANIIKLFIDRQIDDLKYDDDKLFTQLCFISASSGSVDVIKVLINKIDLYYDPALMGKSYKNNIFKHMMSLAAENGHNNVIKLFLDRNMELTSVLNAAATHGQYKTVELLLNNGAKDEFGLALVNACESGYYKTVKLLLDRLNYTSQQIYKALSSTKRSMDQKPIIDLLNKYTEKL